MGEESGLLSGLKESQQVKRWHDRISVSKRWRDQITEENNWERYYDELKGKYDVVLGNTQVPPIGEMFAYKDASLANLYYRDPYIAVNPKKNATILASYILEAGVNHLWGELKLKRDIELELTDGIFVGHAWNKVGSNTKTSGSGDQLKIVEDAIYANRVSWRDMFMNVGTKQPPKDCLWLAQRIYRPTDDVKKDYGRRASKLGGSTHPSIDEKYKRNILYKEDFNFSAIYEIWDARERKIFLVADELMDKYLEEPKPWPDFLDEYPYQFLSFHEIPDEPYPQSDVAPWEAQVKEKIKVFTMMLNHIKRWNRQMVVKKGTMNAQELDKFEKGMDGAILQASTNGDIQSAFRMLDFGTLPPDIYMVLDRIDAVINMTRGMPQFAQGGITRTSTRTEGELQLMKGGADARMDRKQDRLENHCASIARHLVMQMKANFDLPFIAKITGKEPPEIIQAFKDQGIFDQSSMSIKFTKENIQGDFDVSIKAGSTLPLDKMTRDHILDQVMQQGAQLASVPSIPPFLAEIIKERLRDYEIKGIEMAFDQQQQAAAQADAQKGQAAQAQTQKVQAEGQKREAQAQNVQVDTLIKGINAAGKASGTLAPEESLNK